MESEGEAAINWLYNYKIIVNRDKFQVILLDKRSSNITKIEVKIGNENINVIVTHVRVSHLHEKVLFQKKSYF